MSSGTYRVRRATLDDLAQLRGLWQAMNLSVADLEKRLTEFQVAETPDGKVAGALALQMLEGQGLLHSEAFADFSIADDLRPLLWNRVQSVATNHGLFRLWTCEQAPFWNHCGLVPATADAPQKLPEAWRGKSNNWLTLQLREEISPVISAEKEFAKFMEAERRRTEKAFQRARTLKFIANSIAIALAILAFAALIYWARKNPQMLGR